jgi:hypothetical protein
VDIPETDFSFNKGILIIFIVPGDDYESNKLGDTPRKAKIRQALAFLGVAGELTTPTLYCQPFLFRLMLIVC